MKRAVLFLFIILIALKGHTQKEDSLFLRNMAYDVMNRGKAYENLRILCKEVGPRLSGSVNAQKSVEMTAQMLRKAGADTVYLQPCMVPHWERGDKEQGIIRWRGGKKSLHVCALGMSIGTPRKGIRAPIIEVANFDELKALGAGKVKGKIVFFNYPMRPELIQGGYGDAVRYRSNGPIEAAKLGAIAVMIRSVTHALDYNPHTGTTRYDSAVQRIPAMACSTMDAEWLHELLKKEPNVEMFMKMNCRQLADALSYNVVGEIRGTAFPNEIITVGGHLDSWDLGEGAHDDGAGCVQSIEVIRALRAAGYRPKRTIRAVMFMNEENGLKGAQKYAELAELNKEKHIFAIESDAGGFGAEALAISGKNDQQVKLRNWLPLLKPYGVQDMPDGGGGADIGPLRRFGTVLCGVYPNSQRYFDFHHAPNDVFEAVHKRELELGALAMAGIIYLVDKYGL